MSKTLKETRQKLGLTQKQMADLLGTSQHRISEIERGIDGRTESRKTIYHLMALDLLEEHGLIPDLVKKISEIKGGGIMKKSDYWVWYYDDNEGLHRDVISALNPDDAKDIFILSGGDPEEIDRIESK